MLAHRLWRWPNIETALGECPVFAGRHVGLGSGAVPEFCFLGITDHGMEVGYTIYTVVDGRV